MNPDTASDELAPRTAAIPPAHVTVIIPTYNASATLEHAVRSVLEQSLPSIDIHIVDDASTDDSWAVITTLWRDHDNIRATRLRENHGRGFAANYATERARSTWLAILDADDWYEPSRLERLVAAGEARGVEMSADNQFIIDPGNGRIVATALQVGGSAFILDLDAFLANSDVERGYDVGMLKPVFRRSFLEATGVEYYVPARRGQDYYVLLSFFAAGGRAVVIDTPLYNYVQPFGAISRQWSSAGRRRYPFEAMKQVNDHFVTLYSRQFTAHQLSRLIDRGRQFDTVAALHQIREAVAEQDYTRVGKTLMMGFPSRWWRLGRYTMRRILTKLWRSPAATPAMIGRLRSVVSETTVG